MKSKLKPLMLVIVASLVGLPPLSVANAADSNTSQDDNTQEKDKDFDKDTDKLIDILEELNEKDITLEDLDENSTKDINNLDDEAKDFYNLYKKSVQEGETENDIINDYLDIDVTTNEENVDQDKASLKMVSPISAKKYKITNGQMKKLNSIAKTVGVGEGFTAAVAKKFGKSPTWVTIIATTVGALGMNGLNSCNENNNGINIVDLRFSATHSFSCEPR